MGADDIVPNVVTERDLRELAEHGHVVEVMCKAEPNRKGPNWHGLWTMRIVSEEGREMILVTARTRTSRNDIRVREFRTATGVISFLVSIGFSQASIPMMIGHRTSHSLPRT